ncbi:hypothetical protein Cfla_0215 [Cellulomonas flavigena DSM 20109]|uniref:Uncharacterized protein n=1 Tax=Cellulomonas flavigena (strain ATCC 482 / DSM 20109 / BCRC 11376 / JCM 18109 / NBRC 3775 / NCIMB 8073 / NRS 134) TaxID=446466 RepID=D5UGF1_CELFN|nr:hypothetical protein [Cellulomonas flavigena]ADG73134.1 hypothetical protein Cfla_0215 [Cellulomonas flavigena DSM 20109]
MAAGGRDRSGRARDAQDRLDRREAHLARWVTVVVVAVLLGVAHDDETELWPLTAYRLFSGVRTESQVSLELVAVGADGTRAPVPLDEHDQVLATTSHQYRLLREVPPARQREMAAAWLGLAGIDVADVESVEVERVRRTMDARTLDERVTDRRVVVQIAMRAAERRPVAGAGEAP